MIAMIMARMSITPNGLGSSLNGNLKVTEFAEDQVPLKPVLRVLTETTFFSHSIKFLGMLDTYNLVSWKVEILRINQRVSLGLSLSHKMLIITNFLKPRLDSRESAQNNLVSQAAASECLQRAHSVPL